MPYRVYEANEYGVACSGRELYASSELNDAERWVREHCQKVFTCI